MKYSYIDTQYFGVFSDHFFLLSIKYKDPIQFMGRQYILILAMTASCFKVQCRTLGHTALVPPAPAAVTECKC